MEVQIKATGITLTPATKDYVTKKAAAFEKYLEGNSPAAKHYVEVGKTTSHHKQGNLFRAEFNLSAPGRQFRSETEAADLYAAVDEAQEKMIAELRDTKDKETTMFRRGARRLKEYLRRRFYKS